jgi:oxygen-independent coproporphyrinogen III oxidase
MTTAKNNFGIYVQVPFCQTKCTYCNFHTGVVSASRFAPYVDALCKEIRDWRTLYKAAGLPARNSLSGEQAEAVVDTVYFGGGTPSLLEPSLLARLMTTIRQTFGSAASEATLEADPETVTVEKAARWVAAGINRVSFGVQSFVDKELQSAGRMHRREDIYRAFTILRAAGLANIGFDLIAGLPWQTGETWLESLQQLHKLGPEHVSVYLLEVDEGSRLGRELLSAGSRYSAAAVPSDDDMAAFYETACAFLRSAGYTHYEISNWSKPGFASRHNLKYWNREPYLGFGAGAHSFFAGERWANAHDAAAYVHAIESGKLPVEQRETVTPEMALEEELFLGLRKLEGINLRQIEREHGVQLARRFETFEKAGLVERDGDQVRLAEEKLSISNEVFVGLMK